MTSEAYTMKSVVKMLIQVISRAVRMDQLWKLRGLSASRQELMMVLVVRAHADVPKKNANTVKKVVITL